MYKQSASLSEQAQCVASLIAKIGEVGTRFGHSDKDARSIALYNVRFIAYGTMMVLNLLDSWSIGDKAVKSAIPQLLGLSDVTDQSVKLAGDSLHKNSKLSLIFLGQLQIENCLRNLARELNLENPGQRFYCLVESFASRLRLPDSVVAGFNVADLIKDSLQGNGIHSGPDTVTTLGKVNYEFRDQQRVSCASVAHIAHALESNIDNLATIFGTPEVSALKGPVMDQYVWEIAGDHPLSRSMH